ncbi:prolyl oligopeptidase family serine peptidase [Ideonella sp. A 288]|uniref:prolyl oligopeptidase family serine peptidase n=1 Tax=Ideonella sp. A 288 TaxID=1962181 RepID=UPI001303A5A4|nr:prolyl oligopeptidase family serine peptidase [Ideonella sp. A 288]
MRGLIGLVAGLAGALVAAWAAAAPPVFPVKDVPETFFGTVVPDPYRALEDKTAPDVVAWMKAQDAHARAALAAVPGRAGLLAQLERFESAVPVRVVQVVREAGDLWFYLRRGAGENQFKLVVRRGLAGAEKLLVDPEAVEKQTGKPHAINWFSPSPGGRWVAYGLSAQGAEDAALHVLDVQTGQLVGGPVSRADYGGVSWAPDGRRLVFNRLQAMAPGLPETEKYQRSQVLLWNPTEPIEQAVPVFGIGQDGVQIEPGETPIVQLTHDGRWALGQVINGTQSEYGLYLSPAPALLAGKPQWRKLFGADAKVVGQAYKANGLYLRSHDGAPRFKVLRLDLNEADLAQARLIVPAGDKVITGLATTADGLYLEMRDGNIKRLYRRIWGRDVLAEIALPVAGAFALTDSEAGTSAGDPRLHGLVVDLQGWTRARQIHVTNGFGVLSNTGLQPQGPFDAPADLVTTEVQVRSHDGAMVPMSIIHRKGIALDGRNPTLLYGYAAYGITEEPYFSLGRLAFLDAGGVFAVANPRGSSVYGEDWYRGGWQATKPNTWKDFIACAEWLVAKRYTAPERLGLLGGSAGGILVGRAMTERPDLFGAVVSAVGALDMVRAETTPNGVPNIPEFGSRTTEAGFRSLLAMSAYHQVKDGVKYPAVLLTHGVNDPRVEVWQSTKTAARLQAASASGKPVLLRLDWDAGHGIGNTRRQQLEERADLYAFLLWQLGAPAFQPK